jgi:hypothetical protein
VQVTWAFRIQALVSGTQTHFRIVSTYLCTRAVDENSETTIPFCIKFCINSPSLPFSLKNRTEIFAIKRDIPKIMVAPYGEHSFVCTWNGYFESNNLVYFKFYIRHPSFPFSITNRAKILALQISHEASLHTGIFRKHLLSCTISACAHGRWKIREHNWIRHKNRHLFIAKISRQFNNKNCIVYLPPRWQ